MIKNKKIKNSKSIRSKTTKKVVSKRLISSKRLNKKRPVHKRIALHPINILSVLIVGVLLAVSGLTATAASYKVTATVPLPPGPSIPAVITSPVDQQHVSNRVLTVIGTCPFTTVPNQNTWIVLFVNDIWSAVTTCESSGTFSFSAELYPGANLLQVRDYDFYGTPGPFLLPQTVFYDAPQVVTQPTTNAFVEPTTLQLLQVDNGVTYTSDGIEEVSNEPSFSGVVPSFSTVIVTVHSNPVSCRTTADSQGWWSCKINQALPLGYHTVYITVITPSGKTLTYPTFQIKVVGLAPVTLSNAPFIISTNFKFNETYDINTPIKFNLNIAGGNSPYALNIDWGDGKTSQITRTTAGSFEVTHSYSKTNELLTKENIKVEGIDSTGNSRSIEFFVNLHNPAYHNFISYISESTGLWGFFKEVKGWLWLIWPAYFIVVLMVASFWLGEREEFVRLKARHRKKRTAYHH